MHDRRQFSQCTAYSKIVNYTCNYDNFRNVTRVSRTLKIEIILNIIFNYYLFKFIFYFIFYFLNFLRLLQPVNITSNQSDYSNFSA